jgi:hypothetical protein
VARLAELTVKNKTRLAGGFVYCEFGSLSAFFLLTLFGQFFPAFFSVNENVV